nr:MAG TPA: hypothetical protein [Caudoviricetes sp.]
MLKNTRQVQYTSKRGFAPSNSRRRGVYIS